MVIELTRSTRPHVMRPIPKALMALPMLGALLVASPSPALGEVAGGPAGGSALPNELAVFHERLFFVANDGTHGFEPWVSDGTEAGTTLLRDLAPGAEDSFPWPFAATAETLYFGAGVDQRALWRTDGTDEGTDQILPHPSLSGRPEFDEFAATDDRLFFVADDQTTGAELWTSDGTHAGTYLVKDLRPGAEGSHPGRLTAVADRVFFTASTGEVGGDTAGPGYGPELWTSDGTEAGTQPIGDLRPGGVEPRGLTDVGGTLYFLTQGGRIWTSDGTEAGTGLVTRVTPGRGGMSIGDGDLEAVGGRLFFVVHAGKRDELWASDGTEAGTRRLKRFKYAGGLSDVDGSLYFVADDGRKGREPWVSDGSKAGTRLVKDIKPGKQGSRPRDFAGAGESVVFTADDGTHGAELWATDGNGTGIVLDIGPGRPGSRDYGSLWFESTWPVSLGDRVFFPADDGATGTELWVTDGTSGSTQLVADIHPAVE